MVRLPPLNHFVELITSDKLSLEHNHLTALLDTFGQLRQLGQDLLDHNQLTALPYTFGLLHKFRELRLDYNQITALSES